jgi:ribonuclease P protein component
MVLVALPQPGKPLQVGVIASRSMGGAVDRNHAKRMLREAIRPLLPLLPPGWHILLIPRPPLVNQPLAEISNVLKTLLHQAGLF